MQKTFSPKNNKTSRKRELFPFRKSLGQHFLRDRSVTQAIVQSAELTANDTVLEIGPGDGVLTVAIAEQAGRVVALEIDKRLIPILRTTLHSFAQTTIIEGDIMKRNLPDLLAEAGIEAPSARSIKVMGNLPYYITTPILMRLLEEQNRRLTQTITVMVQKEVAERIAAAPGSRIYGALSLAVQYYCDVASIAVVSREAFYPRPKVDSAVLRLTVLEQPAVAVADEAALFRTIRTAFGQRRKTLQNALSGMTGGDRAKLLGAFEHAGIDSGRRAETLSLEEFAKLSEALIL